MFSKETTAKLEKEFKIILQGLQEKHSSLGRGTSFLREKFMVTKGIKFVEPSDVFF